MHKYFITGSTGFLGKSLREKLRGNTYLYNRDQDLECLTRFQPDVIYHLAAEIYDDSKMIESNILLTHRLLEAARKLPNLKAFIMIGSSSEYGRKDHPMSETDFLDPMTMYEATKGASTLLCQTYARKHGVPVVIARPFSLYGKHEPTHRFIPTIMKSIKRKRPLSIAPGVHDFLHIDDFIDGLFLLEKNINPGEIYNFGSETQISNEDLVLLIEYIMQRKTEKQFIPSLHLYDSQSWVSDSSKAHALGWQPQYDLVQGLTKVVKELPCLRSNKEF